MSDILRFAMSDHDYVSPLTQDEMLALASDMEAVLIAHECSFGDPDWRYIDGLRALAKLPRCLCEECDA